MGHMIISRNIPPALSPAISIPFSSNPSPPLPPCAATAADAMSECQALLGEVHAALEKNGESYVRQCGALVHQNIRKASPRKHRYTIPMFLGSGKKAYEDHRR